MNSKFNMPLYSPGKDESKDFSFVIADIGRHNAYLAYAQCKNGHLEISDEKKYSVKDFKSAAELIQKFTSEQQFTSAHKISIAVPGPVVNGKCETQNLPWVVDAASLEKDLNVEKVHLINDLEAIAYSFLEFDKDLLEVLHTSDHKIRGNVAVLAPGKGLGEAGMFWDGESLRPFATEGGHTEFSPRNDFEVEFYQFLNKIYGIVTWENVLSKEGLYNIYRFLRDVGRHPEPEELKRKVESEDFLKELVDAAKTKDYGLVNLTIDMYTEFLAREANNLVLKLKAVGALIITGEIPDVLFDVIQKDKFYKDFIISDKMDYILKDVPIYVVRNKKGILQGAASYGAFIEC